MNQRSKQRKGRKGRSMRTSITEGGKERTVWEETLITIHKVAGRSKSIEKISVEGDLGNVRGGGIAL